MKRNVAIITISVALCVIGLLSALFLFGTIKKAKRHSEEIQQELQHLETDKAALTNTVKDLEGSGKDLEAKLKDAEGKLNELTSKTQEREKALTVDLERREKELGKSKAIAEKYKKDNKKSASQIESLKGACSDLKAECDSLAKDKKDLQEKIRDLETSARSLSKDAKAASLGTIVIKK